MMLYNPTLIRGQDKISQITFSTNFGHTFCSVACKKLFWKQPNGYNSFFFTFSENISEHAKLLQTSNFCVMGVTFSVKFEIFIIKIKKALLPIY